jgi:hypothetical protein
MSSETAIGMIETVKKKLQKYSTLEQNDKVNLFFLEFYIFFLISGERISL